MYLGLVFSQLFSYTGIFQASCHISCREKKRVVIRSHDLHALKREITAIVLLKSKSLCGVFVVRRNFSFLPKIGEAFRESSRCGISSYSRCIPKLLWVISTVTSCTNQNDVMSSLCMCRVLQYTAHPIVFNRFPIPKYSGRKFQKNTIPT